MENSLITDIKYLLRFSYCVHNDYDRYYFPRLRIIIRTNKEPTKPGYSVGIYSDNVCNDNEVFDDKLKKLLKCDTSTSGNIRNGSMIFYDF